ncbi:MAG: agmatinase [Clostridium sp.]|jgi:agmatinase
MLKANIDTFLACEGPYEEAGIVLYGAPFDSTTSYRPGTRFGSRAIRSESYGLESYSPYQDRDLEDFCVFDSGDLELCFGSAKKALEDLEERAEVILEDGKIPFLLGGEHLVTLAAVRAAVRKYPDLAILHFDAHTDLRDEYLGVKLSHACVLRRCWELLGDGRIFQFGIRSGERAEWIWGKDHVETHPFTVEFEVLSDVLRRLEGRPVYLTVDLDVMDPSVFPGTGTPEPGGISFDMLRQAVTQICSEANVVGCDVNELAPMLDASGASTAVACKIVREMLLALQK